MTHKEKYTTNAKDISDYNKKYYNEHRDKLLEKANRRLIVHPNLNKDYYQNNKLKGGKLNGKTR